MSPLSYANSNNKGTEDFEGDASQVTQPPGRDRPAPACRLCAGDGRALFCTLFPPPGSQEGYQPAGCCRIHSLPADARELGAVKVFFCPTVPLSVPVAEGSRSDESVNLHIATYEWLAQRFYGSNKSPNCTLNLPHSSVTTLSVWIGGPRPPRSVRRVTRTISIFVSPTLLARISCSELGHTQLSIF